MSRREQRHATVSSHSSGAPRVTHRSQVSYTSTPTTTTSVYSSSSSSLMGSLFSLGQAMADAGRAKADADRRNAEAKAELDRRLADAQAETARLTLENERRTAEAEAKAKAKAEDERRSAEFNAECDRRLAESNRRLAETLAKSKEALRVAALGDEASALNAAKDLERLDRMLNMPRPSRRRVVETTTEVAVSSSEPAAATALPTSLPAELVPVVTPPSTEKTIYYAVSAKLVSKRNDKDKVSAEEALAVFKTSERFNVYTTLAKAKEEVTSQTELMRLH